MPLSAISVVTLLVNTRRVKFLACCVLQDRKLSGNCLYWLNIVYALKNRVCPEIFHCIEYTFTFRIFEQLTLALKNRVCPEFTVLNVYFLSFRIFEQRAIALKTQFTLKLFKTGGAADPPLRTPMEICMHFIAK